MEKRILIVLALSLAVILPVAAQVNYSNLEFVENKGQWDSRIVLKGELPNGSFFLQRQGFTVILHNAEDLKNLTDGHRGLARPATDGPSAMSSKQQHPSFNPQQPGSTGMRSHAYSVSFQGGNDHIEIIPDKPLPSYNNYFIGNDPKKWASRCQVFQGVTYKNVYPNIDVRYYTDKGSLKYDIIVHPGGDVKQVALRYAGVDKMSIRKNQLTIKTSIGDVQELAPYAYQSGESGREEVNCKYVLGEDNVVRFQVKNHRPNATLVIDPNLVFCTFTGSRASNWGFTATPGPDGTFYAGGIVFGDGFPTQNGPSYQPNFKGGTFDVGIMKFSSNGKLKLYATYIGGGDNETPHSLFSDPQGNLVVLGRTYSGDFPAQTVVGKQGAADMFVIKLTADGSNVIGSMRIGGTGSDCVNIRDQFREDHEVSESLIKNYGDDSRSEVILDGANNIFIAASTQSSATGPDGFPVTAGAFQTTFGGGKQDGVVLKINPNCNSLMWASFLGGSSDDAAFVLKLNPVNGDIYVAGSTASNDFPGNKSGTIQPGYAGGISDAFVAIISNDGSTLKKSTYLGTGGFDAIYGIDFDKKGFPYIMGSTTGDWKVTNNVTFVNAGAKQFVSKLQPDLSAYVYSTTFGNPAPLPNISPVAFLVDRCENVYVSGWGGWLFAQADPYGLSGTFKMPVTANAIQKNTDGRDFYFIVIQKNAASQLYGTFFGQGDGPKSISEHVDGGTSRYDRFGIIYQAICANCGDNSVTPFPTSTAGSVWAWLNGTGGTGCNLAAVKISFNFSGVSADLRSIINGRADSSGCVPLNVDLVDTIHIAKSYIWSFDDGSPDTATISNRVSHVYNNVGTYRVRLIAIDSNSCNVADTVYLNIRGRTDKADLAFLAAKLPPCQSLTYQFTNTSTAPPAKPFSPTSFVWDFGDGSPRQPTGLGAVTHPYASPGTYNVTLALVDTNYCNYPDSIQKTLRVAPLVKAQFETPSLGCAPYTAFFNNTSLAGQQFFWDFGDGSTSTDVNPTHLYADTGTYIVRMTAIDSATCNIIDSTSFTLSVHSKPHAAFTDEPVPPQPNKPTVFFNNSSGADHFKWMFGDGDSTLKNNMDTVIHQYESTGSFLACLIAINQFGCPDTACAPVETIVNPLLDVPNAFTPGRFGQNSTISVRGFGIASLDFRIYNRFGQLVFVSNDKNIAWDGTFNGVPQASGVYAYTLEATFFDGTKTTRKGDITLIR